MTNRRSPRFLVERLEERFLLSHSDGSPFTQDSLLVADLGDADDVVLFQLVAPDTVRLTINGDSHDYFRNSVAGLDISGGNGNDRIEVSSDLAISAYLYGGPGDDTLIGGSGDDFLAGGEGVDSVRGSAGNDVLYLATEDAFDSESGDDSLVLSISGTDQGDVFQIENLDPFTTRVTVNGTSHDYDRNELSSVVISADAGNDVIVTGLDVSASCILSGGDGDDTVMGGAGADLIDGGAGNDSLIGSDSADTLTGGEGNDTVSGGSSDDLVDGGPDNDSVLGEDGSDTLTGGLGDDTVLGGDGTDSIIGGAGEFDFLADPSTNDADFLLGGADNDTISGSIGSDTLDGELGDDSLDGQGGNDILFGRDGSDTIHGGPEDDSLVGGDGDDCLEGGQGSDTMDGGLGFDFVQVVGTEDPDSIAVSSAGPGSVSSTLGGDLDSAVNIEFLEILLLVGDDVATVDVAVFVDAQVEGGDGNDTISSGSGNDLIIGGDGDDSILGGPGYDAVYVSGTDLDETITATVSSSGQVSIVVVDVETDTAVGIEKLSVDALGGFDLVSISHEAGATAIPVLFVGGAGDDTLIGGPEADVLVSAGGNDLLDGGGGDDTLIGSNGNDTLVGGTGHDRMEALGGNDSLDGGMGNDSLMGDDGDDTLFGGDGTDSMLGGTGNDSVDGGAGDDTMVGGDGDDTLDGQVGNDWVYGGLGNDSIAGRDGNDTLGSDQGNDIFLGGAGNDQISGGAGDDILDGGEGSDLLDSGSGRDNLIGGQRNVPRRQRQGCDNDTLLAGADDDTLDGGRGRDRLDGGSGTNDVTIDLARDTLVPGVGVNRLRQIKKGDSGCGNAGGRNVNRRTGPHQQEVDSGETPERIGRPEIGNRTDHAPAIRSHLAGGGSFADLSLFMSGLPAPVAQGGTLTYILLVSNAPFSDPAESVTIRDTLPTGVTFLPFPQSSSGCSVDETNVVTCNLGTMPSPTFNRGVVIKVAVGCTIPATMTITNSALVTSSTPSPTPRAEISTLVTVGTPGITVGPTGGLFTSEAGGSASFSVVLTSCPTSNVTIGLRSSDTTEGTVSPSSVTFTSENALTSQAVTVTGLDDTVDDGDVVYSIITDPATSSDSNYNGRNAADVSVLNRDDYTAGFIVTPTAGLVTTEAGGTATFTIALTTTPSANVTVGLSSSDTTEGTVLPTSVTFTPANAMTPRTVTVTGEDDLIMDGNIVYTIVTAIATSSDPAYNGRNPPDVSVTNTDNEEPAGITVSPTSGLQTSEAGGTATFTVVLNSIPTSNVTIGLISSDTTEGTVSPASLTFTPANAKNSQTVTVTGVDDTLDDGNISYMIVTAAAVSGDANYNARDAADVSATNVDNDTAGITVAPTGGLVTTEAGGTATFTVVLNSTPTANVFISLSSSDMTEGTVSPNSLAFTPANALTPQTVTVRGVNDSLIDGNISYTIVTAPASSADPSYNGLNPADVSVVNNDNDVPGITVTPTSGLVTTESGGTATFSVVLTSLPTADVNIALSSSDSTEGRPSPLMLTFTPTNGVLSQTVTVIGEDDTLVDGSVPYSIITASATSNDPNYNGRNADDVSVTNLDNDGPKISISDASVVEGNSGTVPAVFQVSLSVVSSQTVTVQYCTENNSAVAPEDYSAVSSGTITFNPGETRKPIIVSVNGDTTPELDESFFVNLSSPTNSTIADGQAVGNIVDDDSQGSSATIIINDVTVTEGNSGTTDAVFTVTLSKASTSTVTVQYSTQDNSATAPDDYTAIGLGTVTFNPGQTSKNITVKVKGDLNVEPTETFFVNLSNPTNAAIELGEQGIGKSSTTMST